VSAGFDHDCFVWSPFVNSLLYKLKGHSASLTGVHAVEDSPELITADASGVIKVTEYLKLYYTEVRPASIH
jgi:hypothetical protein